jgi:hypothetical protein
MGSSASEKCRKLQRRKPGTMRSGMNWVGLRDGEEPAREPSEGADPMRNRILAIAAIAGVTAGVLGAPIAAQAQSDARQAPNDMTVGVAPSTTTVVSTPVEIDADGGIAVEQRPAFHQYIVRERVPTYTIPERVIVGGVLPDDGVTTYDVPQTFGVTPYRYTVVNGQTVLVEPRSRRIVQVIE